MADAWDQFPDADAWDQFPDANAAPSRDPSEVDPQTGKTRAQLESELRAQTIRSKVAGNKLGLLEGLGETARAIFYPAVKMTQGAAYLPTMLLDAVTPGQPFAESQSRTFGSQSVFAPRDDVESLVGKSYEGLGGIMAAGSAGQALQAARSPTTQAVGQQLSNLRGQVPAMLGGVTGSEAARAMGAGPTGQTLAGLAGSFAPGLASAGYQRYMRPAPTPEAQALIDKGVKLSPGQQNQGGIYSQIEDAAQKVPVLGPMVQKAKAIPQQQAKDAWIADAAAPGSNVKPTGDLQKTFEQVKDSFGPAYEKFSGYPLVLSNGKPVIVNQGANTPLAKEFAKAVSNKSIDASASTRKQALSWLSDRLTRPFKKSDDLLSLQSDIKSRISAIKTGNPSTEDMAKAEIYEKALESVDNALFSQLPPKLRSELKAVNAQYAKYAIARDAMYSAKDAPTGPTFNQMSTAAQQSAGKTVGKGSYASGEGFMREVPANARKVFAESERTGAILPATTAAYALSPYIAYRTLTPWGRAPANNLPYQPPVNALAALLGNQPWNENALNSR